MPPKVRLSEWLTEGWALIKDDIWTWVLATLLMMLGGLFTLGLGSPALMCGMYQMMFARMRGEAIGAADVFRGFERFGSALLAGLLMGIAYVPFVAGMVGLIVYMAATTPAGRAGGGPPAVTAITKGAFLLIYPLQFLTIVVSYLVMAVTAFTFPLIADRNLGPIEAIKQSYEAVKPHFWMMLLTTFVYWLLAGAGVYACYVGMLVTYPIAFAAFALAYHDFFGVAGVAPRQVTYADRPYGPEPLPPPPLRAGPPPGVPGTPMYHPPAGAHQAPPPPPFPPPGPPPPRPPGGTAPPPPPPVQI